MVRLLPFPDRKTFAFTIVDDTDGATLENVRPVYERLFALGLRTTKSIWVMRPDTAPDKPGDAGDTLERRQYADYIQLLQRRGFEIALHNVSSKSNTRPRTAMGIAQFKEVFGAYPKICVQHEKNLENLYFEFAQNPGRLPPPFRTRIFRGIHTLLRNGNGVKPSSFGCSGEDRSSDYFWGDICKQAVQYVRSNVFFQDLNTLKCNPYMPYTSADTPYVNYWFDSSNGQDAAAFNAILSDRNIARLRRERGCSIVYTHFGKGFVETRHGSAELNAETARRLAAVAGRPDGWYVPAGELLDRLLAFQSVTVTPFAGGFALANASPHPVCSITLQVNPATGYCDHNGVRIQADPDGTILIPRLEPRSVLVFTSLKSQVRARRWYEQTGPAWVSDVRTAAGKLRTRLGHYARNRY
jgi:hypothetical protein